MSAYCARVCGNARIERGQSRMQGLESIQRGFESVSGESAIAVRVEALREHGGVLRSHRRRESGVKGRVPVALRIVEARVSIDRSGSGRSERASASGVPEKICAVRHDDDCFFDIACRLSRQIFAGRAFGFPHVCPQRRQCPQAPDDSQMQECLGAIACRVALNDSIGICGYQRVQIVCEGHYGRFWAE